MSIDISELLLFAKNEGASDLHLSSGEPPIIRVDGDIRKVDAPPMVKEDVHTLLYDILNDRQRKIFEEKHELDLSFNFKALPRLA